MCIEFERSPLMMFWSSGVNVIETTSAVDPYVVMVRMVNLTLVQQTAGRDAPMQMSKY